MRDRAKAEIRPGGGERRDPGIGRGGVKWPVTKYLNEGRDRAIISGAKN